MTDEELSISDVTLIARLRNTPNWMREGFQNWKDNVRTYDTAPFEAAARIEQLVATNEALTEQLAAARQDAKEAETYAWQLEQQLGKAVETLKVALRYNNAMHGGAGAYNKRIKDFIAELKGHDDE